jgi:hypothetical protein
MSRSLAPPPKPLLLLIWPLRREVALSDHLVSATTSLIVIALNHPPHPWGVAKRRVKV